MSKRTATSIVMTVYLGTCTVLFYGACTPGQKQVAKGVIDVLGYACILANADLPDSSAVAMACQLEADAAPAVKKIVDDYKAKRLAFAHQQVSAIRCPEVPKAAVVPDAGAK